MIFAKINPAPVSGSYITAMQATTNVGTESAPFNIHYGEVGFNKSGSVNQFNDSGSVKVTITGSILTKWGTDDAAFLTAVATQLSASVVNTVEGNPRNF